MAKPLRSIINRPKSGALPQALSSIVVVMPRFIGDSVLASIVVQELIRHYGAETAIHCIAPGPQVNLFETIPGLTACWAMPSGFKERKALLKSLNPDAVFMMRHSVFWGLILNTLQIPYRVGFDLERMGLSQFNKVLGRLTHTVPSGRFDSGTHQLRLYQTMLWQVGLGYNRTMRPKIYLTEADTTFAENVLADMPGPRVLLQIRAGSPGKQWSMTHWATVVKQLSETHGASFIGVGAGADAHVYDELSAMAGVYIHNLCGQSTLRQSAALCQQVDLMLSLDTGLAHVAAAVDCPRIVVLYGPTNVRKWKPLVGSKTQLEQVYVAMACRPCVTRSCYHRACLTFLFPERMLFHIAKLMPVAPVAQPTPAIPLPVPVSAEAKPLSKRSQVGEVVTLSRG